LIQTGLAIDVSLNRGALGKDALSEYGEPSKLVREEAAVRYPDIVIKNRECARSILAQLNVDLPALANEHTTAVLVDDDFLVIVRECCEVGPDMVEIARHVGSQSEMTTPIRARCVS
jgi:hypothetical protein